MKEIQIEQFLQSKRRWSYRLLKDDTDLWQFMNLSLSQVLIKQHPWP